MECIKTKAVIEDSIKKSRFIGIILPCLTETKVLEHLNLLNQEHPNASHIVFAYRIQSPKGIIMRFNDAGEPKGTAGKPIFQHLEGKDLINVLIVIIRYFGGIKLGASGLTRAYGNMAKKTIAACSLTAYIEYANIKIDIEYRQMQNLEYQLEKLKGTIIKQEFAENIRLFIRIPKKNLAKLTEIFNL